MNWDHLLSGIPSEEFFRKYRGKEMLYLPGPPEKFTALFSFEALFSLLRSRFPATLSGRIELLKSGHASPFGIAAPGPDGFDFVDRLRQRAGEGWQFRLLGAEDLHSPLAALSRSLATGKYGCGGINAYVALAPAAGLSTHWDDHDVIILQVEGSKHWKVHGLGLTNPVLEDRRTKGDQCPEQLLWEGTLAQGDLLYLPRGYWHVATAMGPSLHLTLALGWPTALTYLIWFLGQSHHGATTRLELPAPDASSSDYIKTLRTSMEAFWTERCVAEFVEERRPGKVLGATTCLPWALQGLPDKLENHILRLVGPPIEMRYPCDDSGEMLLTIGVTKWTVAASSVPIVRYLAQASEATFNAIAAACGDRYSVSMLREALNGLLRDGLVILELS